jgi:hypothetical protein
MEDNAYIANELEGGFFKKEDDLKGPVHWKHMALKNLQDYCI